jgi:hypothetical protein
VNFLRIGSLCRSAFLKTIKTLEHKEVIIGEILPAKKSILVIEQSLANYRSQFKPRVK